MSNDNLANPTVTLGSSTLTLGATTTDITGLTSLVVDSITINGATVSTTAGNTDIVFSPHGTGTITVPAGYEDRAGYTTNSLVNKAYVDQVAQGLDAKPSARAATTVNLASTYDNGTSVLVHFNSTTNGAITLDVFLHLLVIEYS